MTTKLFEAIAKEGFTKYEVARILGARALQIAMNAPLLIKIDTDSLERINYDALKIAELEFNSGILPISVHRPFPKRKDEELKRLKENKLTDERKEELENVEEKEIVHEGEIMELAKPEDEEEGDEKEEAGEEVE